MSQPAVSLKRAFWTNFLGDSPDWYKQLIIVFLMINPLLILAGQEFLAGWLLILEFIFTLAMAMKCYPLQPGGLLAIEAILLGMTDAESVKTEIIANFEVVLLLLFMVAGIFFMKSLLLYVFTKILLNVRSRYILAGLFLLVSAVLSAFLDALTVTAVLITVFSGFYTVYHRYASNYLNKSPLDDSHIVEDREATLAQFRTYLRGLVMHGAVGTALGGVSTKVGEPQNLLIAERAGWDFVEFMARMAPISATVLLAGLVTCILLEKFRVCGFGTDLPRSVIGILRDFDATESAKRTREHKAGMIVQAVAVIVLIAGLAFHVASVGLVGLLIIILLTAFNGITEEHKIGKAFEESLPFLSLLVVFFAIVAVIHEQHLFEPIINWVLAMRADIQGPVLFLANGILSAISDNVFVATVYIDEVQKAYASGLIDRDQFDRLAIAINAGTNLTSVATPNGQAAFLFLLTSALAPLIRLSYLRMMIMAFPYTIVLTIVGLIAYEAFL